MFALFWRAFGPIFWECFEVSMFGLIPLAVLYPSWLSFSAIGFWLVVSYFHLRALRKK